MKLKILEVIDQVPLVRTLRFERPKTFDFRPGQFALLAIEIKGELVKRAYSIASSPTELGHFDLTIKKVEGGKMSPVLYDSKVGDVLEVKGPYGRFYLDETHMDNIVLICGGTGITPGRSIVKYIVDKKLENIKVSLFEGARRPQELIYRDEFEQIHETHDNLGIYFTVNSPDDQHWPWHQGNITIDFVKQCTHQLIGPIYYLCGPPKMVQNLMHDLEEVGVPPKDIHIDQW